MKQAQEHADEDRKRRERIDTKNQSENLLYQTEKNLKEFGDKIDGDSKTRLEAEVQKLRDAVNADNPDEMKAASEALGRVGNEVSTRMYQQGATAGTAEPSGQTSTGQGQKVEEADYEVVDDKDKK